MKLQFHLPQSKRVASNLAAVSILIAIAISLCSLLMVYLSEGWLSSLLGTPDISFFCGFFRFLFFLLAFNRCWLVIVFAKNSFRFYPVQALFGLSDGFYTIDSV